jgi:catechol 2,3-dioxygenase-like lactoylglutathione lyase family enzyme
MLRRIDRHIIRVPQLESAIRYYRDVLGLTLIRQEASLASFHLGDGQTELVLHTDPDRPADATYFLVDDVRDVYRRRESLKLTFTGPPMQVSRGYRATVRDPFGTLLLLLDRSTESSGGEGIEAAKPPGTLFAGIEPRLDPKREVLTQIYQEIGRTADDLPYTPHFETLHARYAAHHADPKPTRHETWRHLLNLRKAGKLPKLGEARSQPPDVSEQDRQWLVDALGDDIGRRDRLPYTSRFGQIVNEFNQSQPRPISPHLVWRLVATLAK